MFSLFYRWNFLWLKAKYNLLNAARLTTVGKSVRYFLLGPSYTTLNLLTKVS
jgi:hypothetical protein